MADMQTDEISARTGFLTRIVTCRIAEAGLEFLRNGHTTRIVYDRFSAIRFDRRVSGRAVLSVKTSEGATTTFGFVPETASWTKVFARRDIEERLMRPWNGPS